MKRTILVATLLMGSSICSQSFGFDLLDRMLGLKGSGSYSSCCDTAVCDSHGLHGQPACGCETACGGACGDVCEPACGLEAANGCGGACGAACEPACGLESACGNACGDVCEPACGLEAGYGNAFAPACGCETVGGCDSGHCGSRGGLLDRLFSGGLHHRNRGCDSACGDICQPACGLEAPCGDACGPVCGCEVVAACDSGCDSGCHSSRPRLLHSLFGHLKGKSHCDSACDSCCNGGCDGYSSAPVMAAPAPVTDEQAAPMPPAPSVDPSAHLQSKRRVIQASASYIR